MSITALVWIVLYCAAAVISFFNPLFGSLGYLLEYYMRPELHWWGRDLPSLRWNLLISVVLGATFLMRRSSLRKMSPARNGPFLWLAVLALIMILVTLTVAVDPAVSRSWAIQWAKMALIFPLLVIGVVRSRGAFNAFVAANMGGAFWWGWLAWTDPKRAEGRLLAIGSGDSLNDNSAAAHLLTVLALSVIYLLVEKDKRLRILALISIPFIINTLILCNSRGSMVALAVALAFAPFLIRKGRRVRMVIGGACLVGAVFLLADPQFIERQQTTARYEEDSSAQQRLTTWKAAAKLVMDRPFGAGGRGFHLLSPIYIPAIVAGHRGEPRAPHNTWAMVASEWGVLGLFCFAGAFAATFAMLERIKRASKGGAPDFFYWRAYAIQLGLIAYLIAAAFTDRLYGEAGYWMIALTYALYRIQLTEASDPAFERVLTLDSGRVPTGARAAAEKIF